MVAGFVIIDASNINTEQRRKLEELVHDHDGWLHPDGARYVFHSESPQTTKASLIKKGWPSEVITIPI